ncbi:excinuclease ABC, B subunit [Anaerofustis stercorihominis DSM 17244]|uniref:UvrABC system protein B n=1 Tax=Anaerofustis stercorihominis DSM 17244 TaxID=445971 RepID=B1C9F0_9FIRM|nr:excinuclease ABC subunit UvrB [Anaerofustis stercorihominis]EDS72521.1 excinuclease ABC, B subunit [Anaerofustis stercorihominis DSM 17244]
MPEFKVHSPFEPSGGQPEVIDKLSKSILSGNRDQTLLGVTGCGKTYIMAKIIEKVQRPALIMAHNKTLAAQLANEFRSFFPDNAVEYFVSYYDYYQPEAYVPGRDLYIAKDSSINDDIDKLRHSATSALFERKDVIIIASVSCIYGLGSPFHYKEQVLSLRPGMIKERDDVIRKLIDIQYTRNDIDFHRGTFRVRGDSVEVFPANSSEEAIRIEFFDDEIDRILEINSLTGEIIRSIKHPFIYPASHYVTDEVSINRALKSISEELKVTAEEFEKNGKLLEAQRIRERTNYDIEMLREIGSCKGIENYSRHLNDLPPGAPPYTLLDYFPKDFVTFIDESHVSVPQIRGMYAGDRARKMNLVDYGFRLPSALDNRPLNFEEFEERMNQLVYVSATPNDYEKERSKEIAECIVRPTGLIDPKITVKETKGQIEDLIGRIKEKTDKHEKVLVTTLTKRMAEDLTNYLSEVGIRVEYLHSDVDTIERMKLIKDLRDDVFDVLVGINLLREGLDIPEVSLVAILDADKEGFLRSETSLIQTIGRAARHLGGEVVMYADKMTPSMERAIGETDRRRKIQSEYNEKHHITPKGIVKSTENAMSALSIEDVNAEDVVKKITSNKEEFEHDVDKEIELLTTQMKLYAKNLEFELAAKLRDEIDKLKKLKTKQ